MAKTSDPHAELRQRLRDLVRTAGLLDTVLAAGQPLPTFTLARAAVDVDKAASRLARHADRLAGE
jgi:hypothetical protein